MMIWNLFEGSSNDLWVKTKYFGCTLCTDNIEQPPLQRQLPNVHFIVKLPYISPCKIFDPIFGPSQGYYLNTLGRGH